MKMQLSTPMLLVVIMALIVGLVIHHEEMSHRVANYRVRETFRDKAVQDALKTESELNQARRETKKLKTQVKALQQELWEERTNGSEKQVGRSGLIQ